MATVWKTCQKCGAGIWCKPRERRCKMGERTALGRSGYYCWGKLVTVRAAKKPKPVRRKPAAVKEPTAAERGELHRQRAQARQRVAERQLSKLSTRIKRLQTAARKCQLKIDRFARQAEMTDAEVEAVRQRARHAAHVQKVQRRLIGKPVPESEPNGI